MLKGEYVGAQNFEIEIPIVDKNNIEVGSIPRETMKIEAR